MSKAEPIPQLTVDKLRAAKYNPRTITQAKLDKLKSSLASFGDLSGVVFNIRTKTLVSGHQRMKTVAGLKTKIIQTKTKDKHGTVSVGHIEAITENGVIKIPFRSVDWDIVKEKAANIAANAHGGSFDKEKLRLVLADIENTKKFDIELTGLDPLTLKSLRIKDSGPSADTGEFPALGEDLKTTNCCPRCSYRW